MHMIINTECDFCCNIYMHSSAFDAYFSNIINQKAAAQPSNSMMLNKAMTLALILTDVASD